MKLTTATFQVVVVISVLLLAGCGGRSKRSQTLSATAPVTRPLPVLAQRLPIGISENNPWLIDPGPVPAGFGPWRDRVAALHPAYYRLFVDWSTLQDDPAQPVDLAAPDDGCLRGLPPCGPFAGMRDRLRAVAARQRADGGGWQVMVVIYGAPPWAARPPSGCERPDTQPRSRPYNAAGLAGYRRLIRALLALGRQEGVTLRYWSPFNEPNHPGTLSPQRATCRTDSPSLAPGVYSRIVRAARDELAADSAPHELILGEMAGYRGPSPRGTGVREFVRALPDDVACAGAIWSQHQYAQPDRSQPDAVAELEQALDERPCTRGKPIWVTETGVGGVRAGVKRSLDTGSLARACAAQADQMDEWAADPRVRAVFQFSVREDFAYPVGLFDPGLTRVYPTYGLWRAWGEARAGSATPPARPPDCG